MIFNFIHFLKIAAIGFVVAGISSAEAGSYEDFFAAVKRDDPGTVTALLQRGFDPNTPSPDNLHGLFMALREGSVKVARVLAEAPATQVEWRSKEDESPLMLAAIRGELALAKRLIERGADVNKPGWAPLHYAASGGHVPVLELLLEHHALIDAESPNGTTPLMMAAHYGTPEAVKHLLEAGADIHMKNQLGLTALDFARRGSRPDAIKMITAALQATPKPAPTSGPAREKGKW